MFTENGLVIDLDDVGRVVEHADVFTIGFRLFPERLLVDTRIRGDHGVLIRLVEPASSIQERFFTLGRLRPDFGPPERFMFFLWPHSVGFLRASGTWRHIGARAERDPHGRAQLEEAWASLVRLEREAEIAAIGGENCHTIWSAQN